MLSDKEILEKQKKWKQHNTKKFSERKKFGHA